MSIISPDPYIRDSSEILNNILSVDEGVFKRLMETYDSKVDYETSVKVLTLLTAKRTLDKMPTPIKYDKDVGVKSGVREYFKVFYAGTQGEDEEEILGQIHLGGAVFSCDFAVVRTLKALMKTGRSPNENISQACTKIVKDIFALVSKGSHITVKDMCKALEAKGYYEKEIVSVIKEVHGCDEQGAES